MKSKLLFAIISIGILKGIKASILISEERNIKQNIKLKQAKKKIPKGRMLAFFTSDDKTKEIHKLKIEVEDIEGLSKAYQGNIIRRYFADGSH